VSKKKERTVLSRVLHELYIDFRRVWFFSSLMFNHAFLPAFANDVKVVTSKVPSRMILASVISAGC
jgi:hypothetical protein